MPGPTAGGPAILQVLPALGAGGVEKGTVEIAQALREAGWTALVASRPGARLEALRRAGGQHLDLPMDSKNPLRIRRNARVLEGVIRECNVSLVHARSRAPAWSALWASRRAGVPFVTTYHGTYNENFPGKRRYNAVMAAGDRVIAISRFIADHLMARHGTDPSRVRVIPRGVDPAVFDPQAVGPQRILRLARAWNLLEGQPTILLPGRLTRWKGQHALIEAVGRMARPDVRVLLVGDAQGRERYVARLRALAARLGVQLTIPGPCEDMPAALMLADVVVNASLEPEAFGRVVIEGQAMGRPVVAFDHGGAAETIRDGETGLKVPVGDIGALAGALADALSLTNGDRLAIGQAARAQVLAHNTTAMMQAATLDVYRELLG
jgi:glycosyltransferase involved in cell wall biosynthesis